MRLFEMVFTVLFLNSIMFAQQSIPDINIKELMMQSKFREVINNLSEKEKISGLNYEENKALGQAYQNLFNFNAAVEYFVKAREISGYNFDINYMLGKAALANGNSSFAKKYFAEILRNDFTNITASIELANILIDNRKYNRAKQLLTNLIKTDTLNTYLLNKLAYCYGKVNDVDNAVLFYRKVLAINPFDQTAGFHAAKILYDSEKYSEAREILDKTITGNTNSTGVNKLMAEVLFKQENYEAGVGYYLKTLALGDSSAGVFQKLGFSYYFISVSGSMVNEDVYSLKINEAISALTKSYELDSLNPLTTLYLGICYKELKNYTQAEFYLEKTLNNIIPKYMGDVYTHLGATLQFMEKYSEAIEAYRTAYEYEPADKKLLFYIASAMDRYYADKQPSFYYYKKFLSEDKTENQILLEYARERIEKLTEHLHFNGSK